MIAGPLGAKYQVPGGGTFTLSAGAKALVAHIPHKLTIRAGQHPWTYSVFLTEGRVDVDMGPKVTRSAVFVTSTAGLQILGARGKFSVVATADEAAAANFGGQVMTAVNNRWRDLAPGKVWVSHRRSARVAASSLPEAPKAIEVSTVLAAPGGVTSLPSFSWSPVAGAASYEVRIVKEGERRAILAASTQTPEIAAQPCRLVPGHYQITVTPADVRGFQGAPSEPVRVTVVGVALPDGALVSRDGTVQLGAGQAAHFTYASDLKLSYSGSPGTLSGGEAVGLGRGFERVVLLRRPGTTDGAVFRLARRELRAEVTAGPKRLAWPGPAAEVRFELNNGRDPVPEWVKPNVSVTLNLQPVQTSWKRSGSTWSTTIRPRRGVGPWTLRVEVKDQFGVPLGEDLLEIVGNSTPGGPGAGRPGRSPRS